MDTLQEALFRAMLNDGWFTDSDGDVEAPTGYFGYVVNDGGDWTGVEDAFSDVIESYAGSELSPDNFGAWADANFYGVYSAFIDSNGIITIYRHGDYVRTPGVAVLGIEVTPVVRAAQRWYKGELTRYNNWQEN